MLIPEGARESMSNFVENYCVKFIIYSMASLGPRKVFIFAYLIRSRQNV